MPYRALFFVLIHACSLGVVFAAPSDSHDANRLTYLEESTPFFPTSLFRS